MYITELPSLECRTRNEAGQRRTAPSYASVRHEHIKRGEEYAHQYIRDKLHEQRHGRTKQYEVGQTLHRGRQEDGQAARQNPKQRQHEKNSCIVRQLAEGRTRPTHLPDLIERRFDGTGQRGERPAQQEKAEAEKDTATRMFEIRIDEPDDYVHRGLGRMQFVADALLYVTVKPKATCNGKDDGQQRYGRKQRPVRQGRSHAVEPFTFETTHCQHNAFHRSASQLSGTARAGGITPKPVTQEAQRAHNLSGDPCGQFHRHFLLFFFSRHRGGISDGEEAEQWEKDTKGGDVNGLGRSTSLLLQAKLSNSTQNGIVPPTKMPHSPFAPHTSRLSAPE